MSAPKPLGEFEQLVLLAILQLAAGAHGVGIGRALEEQAGRSVSRGALYTTLDRLEVKGLVRWKIAPGGAERARRPRRLYTVSAKGVAALRQSHRALARLSRGLESILKNSERTTSSRSSAS
jgi:DNA-binding PadR family transcriptional regulator